MESGDRFGERESFNGLGPAAHPAIGDPKDGEGNEPSLAGVVEEDGASRPEAMAERESAKRSARAKAMAQMTALKSPLVMPSITSPVKDGAAFRNARYSKKPRAKSTLVI